MRLCDVFFKLHPLGPIDQSFNIAEVPYGVDGQYHLNDIAKQC